MIKSIAMLCHDKFNFIFGFVFNWQIEQHRNKTKVSSVLNNLQEKHTHDKARYCV